LGITIQTTIIIALFIISILFNSVFLDYWIGQKLIDHIENTFGPVLRAFQAYLDSRLLRVNRRPRSPVRNPTSIYRNYLNDLPPSYETIALTQRR